MQPAARKSDKTRHGGQIIEGSRTVQIGGKPAGRLLDKHWCPRHGEGYVGSGSRTVLINGRRAARKQDICDCETVRLTYGDLVALDSDGDDTKDTLILMVGAVRMREEGYADIGPVEVGGQYNLNMLYAEGQGRVSTDSTGIPGGALVFDAQAGVWKLGLGLSTGPAGDKGQNPFERIYVEADFLHAAVGADVLFGDDGSRVGISLLGYGYARVAGITASEWQTIAIPGTDLTIEINKGATGAVYSVGGGAGGKAYWDKAEDRFYLFGLVDVAPIFGEIGGFIGISIGKKRTGTTTAGSNDITTGLQIVQVGG